MMRLAGTDSPRRQGQRGNAFVEGAFVLVPLFALIFAIVDFSVAIFVRSTMQHAVREGTRYAITYQLKSGMGHDASIKSVVQSNAMGFLNGEDGLADIHIRYYDPVTLTELGTGAGTNAPGNLVEVSVENYTWGWISNLSGEWTGSQRNMSPLQITTRSSDRMEGLAGGTSPPTR